MAIFELLPVSKPNGSFVPEWFDDEACLWNDERLTSAARLAGAWKPPALKLQRPAGRATAVLFNPNAFAVSQGVRDKLASYDEIEFLPVRIQKHGIFYILHVTAAVELPQGSKARVAAPPSRNIVEIHALPRSFRPSTAFFRVLQPKGSAARAIGATTRDIYLSTSGARAIEAAAHGYLTACRVAGA